MATRQINLITLHCSATPNGRWTTARDVDGWHRDVGYARYAAAREKFNPHLSSIGYHYLIYTNGALETGRHVDEIGAHAAGWNSRSIGICLIGTDRYSPAQWDMLAEQVRHLCHTHRVPLAYVDSTRGKAARGVCGHRDLSPDTNHNGIVEPREWLKTCPGFSVRDWIANDLVAPAGAVLEETPK